MRGGLPSLILADTADAGDRLANGVRAAGV